MAFFPTNQNLFSVVLVIFTTSFLLLATELVTSQKTVSFDITNFSTSESDISLQGSASILSNGILDIANPANSKYLAGRALYSTPVPIWDKTIGNVASFVTSFSFRVHDYQSIVPTDGFVFILVPQDRANIPSNSNGGNLGIVDGNSAYNPFVGVEFDNYVNEWDPKHAHVGINANSLISLKTVKWKRVSSALVNVKISYDNHSKTLNVVVYYPDGTFSTVAQVIDLKAELPETARIGFSAATSGGAGQLVNLHSWSFKLKLDTTTPNNIASYSAI